MRAIGKRCFFCCLFLIACSTHDERHPTLSDDVPMTIGKQNIITIPNIEERIVDQGNYKGGIGPFPVASSEEMISGKKRGRTPVVALILGPGINRSVAYISVLDVLKQHNISIPIISGIEMGAIIAALYAKGLTPQSMEWFFYKFFSKVNKLKPYSKKWKKILQQSISREFGDFRLEALSSLCILPLFNRESNDVEYFSRGNLQTMLDDNLELFADDNSNGLMSSLQKDIYNVDRFYKLGADIVVVLNVLGDNVTLLSDDEYISNVFKKASNKLGDMRDGADLFVDMSMGEMPLDSYTMLPAALQKSHGVGKSIANDILMLVDKWKKERNEK